MDMGLETLIISAFVTTFSLGLLIVSLVSYRKYKNLKLLFVSFVFVVLFIKGVLLSVTFFTKTPPNLDSVLSSGLFDLIILVFLFIATLKR